MKKLLFVAATAALALSSCSDNEIATLSVKQGRTPISINVYQQAQTRVTETTLSTLQGQGFTLYAFEGQKQLFDSYAYFVDNAWILGDVYYWPTNSRSVVDFYAYYDPDQTFTSFEDKTQELNFGSFDDDIDRDIVVAHESRSFAEADPDGSVSLKFKHINAEVVVSAVATEQNFDYRVKSTRFMVPTWLAYNFVEDVTVPTSEPDFTTTLQYFESPDGLSVGSALTPLDDTNMRILPATTCTIEVEYEVSEAGAEVWETLVKSADVDLQAGCVNRINVNLDRAVLTIKVDAVEEWIATENVINTGIAF